MSHSGEWGFEGYMTSDSDSCGCILNGHPTGEDHFPAKVRLPRTFLSSPFLLKNVICIKTDSGET
jgi:hypothetical protein